MKLLLLVILLFSAYFSPVNAGQEDKMMNAGEKNTQMYRLHASNSVNIKRYRAVDEMIARDPSANIYDESQIKSFLLDEKPAQITEDELLGKMLVELQERVKNKKNLAGFDIEKNKQIHTLSAGSVRDEIKISEVKTRLRRLRR